MLIAAAALLLAGLLLLPMKIQTDAAVSSGFQGRATLHYAGLHKTLHLFSRDGQLFLGDKHRARPLKTDRFSGKRKQLFCFLCRNLPLLRYNLQRRVRVHRLDALLLLRTQDAARSALLSGTLQGALSGLPEVQQGRMHIRIMPEFFRPRSSCRIRCIISVRPGTLLLTAIRLLFAYLQQQPGESEALS
ncbi:MAG: hypothetical protein IJB81_10850 [Clostridia bacterium]|nr:hypothetical protein [Clostridia bacterium]